MKTPVETIKRAPLPVQLVGQFQDLARFVRSAAPRWLNGSHSLARLLARRSRQREATRGRRRGIRYVDGPTLQRARRSGPQPSF